MTGKQGAQPVYSDLAIETALPLRLLFRLPLRQTEGFLRSVLQLMEVTLPCPDHTTLSRRHPTVAIRQQVDRASEGPISLIVDSRGLQVCGQGAWHAQKHGEKKPKRWKKLHIGVDTQGQIVASALTASSEQDPSQVPALLCQVGRVIARFIGDGMYDQEPVCAAVRGHAPEARVIVRCAPHVMLFFENLIRALLMFNGLRSRYCQRALLVYHYQIERGFLTLRALPNWGIFACPVPFSFPRVRRIGA